VSRDTFYYNFYNSAGFDADFLDFPGSECVFGQGEWRIGFRIDFPFLDEDRSIKKDVKLAEGSENILSEMAGVERTAARLSWLEGMLIGGWAFGALDRDTLGGKN